MGDEVPRARRTRGSSRSCAGIPGQQVAVDAEGPELVKRQVDTAAVEVLADTPARAIGAAARRLGDSRHREARRWGG